MFNVWSTLQNASTCSQQDRNTEASLNIRSTLSQDHVTFKARDVDVSVKDTILISKLNLEITNQMNVLITGPSGAGKSTLIKTLCGVQPVRVSLDAESHAPMLMVPPDRDVVYLPQHMYMIEGSLRHALQYLKLIAYPDLDSSSLVTAYDRSLLDIDIPTMQQLLEAVGLVHLTQYGWDDLVVWSRVLSVGEQQRLMIASAILSPARCVVMDEATSACDVDIESAIFRQLATHSKQFVTVTHRNEVRDFHTHNLYIIPGN